MKKFFIVFAVLAAMFLMVGCGGSNNSGGDTADGERICRPYIKCTTGDSELCTEGNNTWYQIEGSNKKFYCDENGNCDKMAQEFADFCLNGSDTDVTDTTDTTPGSDTDTNTTPDNPDSDHTDSDAPDSDYSDTEAPSNCTGLSFDPAMEYGAAYDDEGNVTGYYLNNLKSYELAGFSSEDQAGILSLEFYPVDLENGDWAVEAAAVGTYGLGTGRNTNYSTCNQCVRLHHFVYDSEKEDWSNDKQFFQQTGTLQVTKTDFADEQNPYYEGVLTVKLVEATVDSSTYTSTFVEGGDCYEIESANFYSSYDNGGSTTECSSGQYMCTGSYSYYCSSGYWDSGTYCSNGCNSSTGQCNSNSGGGGGDSSPKSPCPPEASGSVSGNYVKLKWTYKTSSGCGTPTKTTVKWKDPDYGWIEFDSSNASSFTSASLGITGCGYQEDGRWLLLAGIIVENDAGGSVAYCYCEIDAKQCNCY